MTNLDRLLITALNQRERESTGNSFPRANANIVISVGARQPPELDDPMQCLLSDSEGSSDVKQVRVQDRGSKPRKVKVVVGGVPVLGVVDTAADVTIVGGEVFKQVAVVLHVNSTRESSTWLIKHHSPTKPLPT